MLARSKAHFRFQVAPPRFGTTAITQIVGRLPVESSAVGSSNGERSLLESIVERVAKSGSPTADKSGQTTLRITVYSANRFALFSEGRESRLIESCARYMKSKGVLFRSEPLKEVERQALSGDFTGKLIRARFNQPTMGCAH